MNRKTCGDQSAAYETLKFATLSGAWVMPGPLPGKQGTHESETPADLPVFSMPGGGELALIREEMGDCERCRLAGTRKHIVFGVGDAAARLMFVGEGPGEEEDRRGEPFVGRAGGLLDRMMHAIGFKREEVYIANVIKCRPPKNRDPAQDEISACKPFLLEQINAIRPVVICALGAHAARSLLDTDEAIGKLRGRVIESGGMKVVATYHPAYLLRNPSAKYLAWQDLKIIRDMLNKSQDL